MVGDVEGEGPALRRRRHSLTAGLRQAVYLGLLSVEGQGGGRRGGEGRRWGKARRGGEWAISIISKTDVPERRSQAPDSVGPPGR